jgi:uncharacterized protein YqjF (DUF2071 family)
VATSSSPRPFLEAEWRHLVMLNYPIDPELLRARVPAGTRLDTWQGRCFLSVVGFLFLRTRVLGVAIPFHRDFEEVNLRFYVVRETGDEQRRGVVFVKEVVPRLAVAATARLLYGENYVAQRMWHRLGASAPGSASPPYSVEYGWGSRRTYRLSLAPATGFEPLRTGSEEEFISEHYWGYSRRRDGATVEYRVEHPPWRVAGAGRASFEGDAARLYGPELGAALAREPASAFLAEGSAVRVHHGVRL